LQSIVYSQVNVSWLSFWLWPQIARPPFQVSLDGAELARFESTALGSCGARNGAKIAIAYMMSRTMPPPTASLLCLNRRAISRHCDTSPTSDPRSLGVAVTSWVGS
jgi:hypothetical protein